MDDTQVAQFMVYMLKRMENGELNGIVKYYDRIFAAEQRRISELQEVLEKYTQFGEKMPNFEVNRLYMNTLQFVQLSMLDMVTSFKHYNMSQIEWERNSFGRQLVLQMYEFVDDIPHVVCRDMGKVIVGITGDNDHLLIKQLNSVTGTLIKIFNKFKQEFGAIRNTTQAHRNHDVISQMQVIQALDWEKTSFMCLYLFGWRYYFNEWCNTVEDLLAN